MAASLLLLLIPGLVWVVAKFVLGVIIIKSYGPWIIAIVSIFFILMILNLLRGRRTVV